MDKRTMDDESTQQPTQPSLCANGCGFFGNSATGGLCSKCFRDTQAKAEAASAMAVDVDSVKDAAASALAAAAEENTVKDAAAASDDVGVMEVEAAVAEEEAEAQARVPSPAQAPAPSPAPSPSSVMVSAGASGDGGAEKSTPAAPKVQKNTGRCWSCRKKVGLTGIKCRCGYVFCSLHRLAEQHDCPYDYKASGREQIAAANPLVVADKIDKI